ncbi:MAG: translation initiation factor [Pyramidobacter sp.]|uniref:translation initiation factor n=1 Tax=Pyramidobacter sp. TaxID=1943581 RepID=UPI002A7FDB8E|nr:translation initiation factor [Pyramidobacter sp.]MDY4033694.1 translation initiation factor [Pyramidobacter sp.]
MRSSQKRIDLDKLDAESFTIADAMGLSREPARLSAEEPSRADAESARDHALESVPLRLFLERKGRSGKNVTRLVGLPPGERSGRLVKELKQNLGCGAAIKEDDVFFQGDQRVRLSILLKDLGARNVKIV